MLKVGLVGVGGISGNHIPGLGRNGERGINGAV